MNPTNDYASIIVTSYRHGERDKVARESFASLFQNTTYPFELCLTDNTHQNLGYPKGRNQAATRAGGSYIVIADDDIIYQPGWLEECIAMVNLGDKFMATPVWQPRIGRWELASVNGYRQNYRTGSNCMVMRRSAFDEIGPIDEISMRHAGTIYANKITRAGYTFLITKEPMAYDAGFGKPTYILTAYL